MHKTEYFLSRRLLHSRDNQSTRPIVNLAVVSITICLIIITAAIAITTGYRHTIEQKVIDMGSHIRISNYDMNYTYDPKPISRKEPFFQELRSNKNVAVVQYFSTKVGIIKTEDQVEGVVFKGIDSSFSWGHFQKNITNGKPIDVSTAEPASGILLSSAIAQKLQLSIGNVVYAYFVQDPPMQRKFIVEGIYETGLPEYDEKFILCDLRHIQKLNGWDGQQVGGVEILINDYSQIDEMGEYVNSHIGYQLKAETIKQIYPAIFQWTALFNTNAAVLLCITILICAVSLISTFFIIILEQTSTIGILKTMGLSTPRVRNVFLLIGGRIVLRGMLLGNIIGIAICLAQQYFHFIKLDPTSYYVAYVPIGIPVPLLLLVNLGVLLICLLALLIPSAYISKRITTISAIRFE